MTPSHCFDTVHPPPPRTVARPRRSAADRAENILARGGGALALLSSVPSSFFSQSAFVDKRPAGPFEVPSLDSSPLSRPTPSVLRRRPLPFVHQLVRRGLGGLFALECMSGITSPSLCLSSRLSDKHDRHRSLERARKHRPSSFIFYNSRIRHGIASSRRSPTSSGVFLFCFLPPLR